MKKIALWFLCAMLSGNCFAAMPKVSTTEPEDGFAPWTVEDHYLPIVAVKIAFTGSGVAYDPADKLGLAELVASLIDEGADGMSSFEFRKRLEELATDISFEVDNDNFYVTIRTMGEDLPEALHLLNIALTKPDFDKQAIKRVKNQVLIELAKNEEDPQYLASRKFSETIFNNHPYSNPKLGTKETIERISRDDLVKFVKTHFTRQNAKISIVGDIAPEAISALLAEKLTLPYKQLETPKLPEVSINDKGNIIRIEKNIPQSVVIFGMRGLKRSDSDFYPAYVMNYILGGGGFESRLMNEVREKNGLAYTVYTYLNLMQQAGLINGYVATDGNKVDQSIELIKQQMQKIADEGVTADELQNAKNYLINSFPLKMTKNSDIANFVDMMQTESLGVDFLEKRDSYVTNVTLDEVNLVAKKLLKPENMIFVVVGKTK
jgi:zinc protease